jgi:hypothetical protein
MKLAATNTIKVVKLVVLFIILPSCSKKDTSDHFLSPSTGRPEARCRGGGIGVV